MSKGQIGFVGIGTMGWPMARNIHEKGYSVTVYDLNPATAARFVAEIGGKAATSMADIARCDMVVTMLPNGFVVREVLTEADGGAFVKGAKPGTIVIDMSSSAPTGTREIAQELAEKGIAFIDAPVSGAKPRAEDGTLTIMIGGDDAAAIEKAKPLLATMGDRLFDTGGSGTGHAAKALNNFVAAATYAATSEAVLIARRFGLDDNTLIDIMSVSTGKSFITDIAMKHFVLNGRFGSGFALSLLTKDIGIAADLGRDVGLDAPVQRLVLERFKAANAALPGADNTEAIKVWDNDLDGQTAS